MYVAQLALDRPIKNKRQTHNLCVITMVKKFEEKSREIMVRKKVDQYSCRQCNDNEIQDGTDLRKRVEAKRRF